LIEEDYWPLNTTLYSIDLRRNKPRYLWFMLQSVADLFVMDSLKSAVPGVDRNDIHQIKVVVPPSNEQDNIVNYLDTQTTIFDNITSEAASAINRLTEYRTALISAAVTGKIDVRGSTT